MRSCPYCRETRAYRILLQVREEGACRYSLIQNFDAYRKKLKRDGFPYIGFPLPEGHIVISVVGDQMLLGDIALQIEGWIERSLPDKNISASRGFGGEHAGCRPTPERDRYIHSEAGLGTILSDLKTFLKEKRVAEDGAINRAEKSEQTISVPLGVVSEEDVTAVMK